MTRKTCKAIIFKISFCMSEDVYLSSLTMTEFLNHPVHEALVVGKNWSPLHLHDPVLLGPAVLAIVDSTVFLSTFNLMLPGKAFTHIWHCCRNSKYFKNCLFVTVSILMYVKFHTRILPVTESLRYKS